MGSRSPRSSSTASALPADSYVATPDQLTIAQPPHEPFTLEIETLVDPSANTQLSGLYRSSGTYCTQCEAEGFRRITYFPDRPDVMAVYTTRIEADKAEAPVLLANGNLRESGDLPGGRHFAVWHDPYPKPAYLFALVGGDLGVRRGHVPSPCPAARSRCASMSSPARKTAAATPWIRSSAPCAGTKQAFGREYDLDMFMIVAVSDFNMGAMENKGLNVFNDKYVLASPETATDSDFAGIEAIIAHEYFHNWTGNRITCRDWFQLCLKEGLTVFRDQEFTVRPALARGQAHRRRARLARAPVRRGRRPPRPSGAARGLSRDQQLLHHDGLREGRRGGAHAAHAARPGKVPQRHGPLFRRATTARPRPSSSSCNASPMRAAATCSQFMRWYSQAGTPEVVVAGRYDAAAKTYPLDLHRSPADARPADAKSRW